jgi:hypothetical protein
MECNQMTRDDIKSLAMESIDSTEELLFGIVMTWDEIERFAYLIADIEREECAKECESLGKIRNKVARFIYDDAAEYIRAKGQE